MYFYNFSYYKFVGYREVYSNSLEVILADVWKTGYCKDVIYKTFRRELANNCKDMENGCTKDNCLTLCKDLRDFEACEYESRPKTKPNCVGLLHGVKKETKFDSYGFCYMKGTLTDWLTSDLFDSSIISLSL